MRILSRYVFREILAASLLGTALATAVIFLQKIGQLFELLVRSSAKWDTIAYLLLLALPQVLPLTIPFGVLVGILIGLGRMSSDGEITAMRAAGVSSRRLIFPVLTFALLATTLAGWASLRWTPLALRETYRIVNKLTAGQLSAEIQPRVFEEQVTNNTILYVADVRPGPIVLWRNVFMADLTPPDKRNAGLKERADGPLITVAREALVVPDAGNNRLQLTLKDASTHEMGKDGVGYDSWYPKGTQGLDVNPPVEKHAKPFTEMNTRELSRAAKSTPGAEASAVEARIELHRRFALPLACIMLALVGIPLGITSRKGGKSSGYVTAVFLSFFCYYLAFISLVKLANQKTLSVEVALWLPNEAFLLAGLLLIVRLERPGDRDFFAFGRNPALDLWARFGGLFPASKNAERRRRGGRLPLLPQLVDTYILSGFIYYLFLLVASFVSMTLIYNFFELLGDIVKNNIPLTKVFTYLFFLTPQLIYATLPISVLVAVLVTFGVMTKNNEITAFKACGVSLYRLSVPILIVSGVLSCALFAFDHYYVPGANRRQDALRNEIKNKPVQTYLRPDRKWILGAGGRRIYYYRYLDPSENVMAGASVYEIEPTTFRLLRWISAERAQWQPSLKTWIFQNGWDRDFRGPNGIGFKTFQATTFPELTEAPGYFLKEIIQDKQMNFVQLDNYIRDLQQSGFDTVKLRVQFYRKFSVPLFALIMAMIAIPFGFLVGNRGAMTGIGVSIGIAIAYWGIGILFEQLGNVNLLPPTVAAWAPDAVFSLAGLYLMLRMKT